MYDFDLIRRNIEQSLGSFQNISHMTKNILHALLRLIWHVCENAKSCNIYEVVIVKLTDIKGKWCSCYNCICSLQHILGNMQTTCKIIRRSGRNISDRRLIFSHHHTGHDFIQCTISATTCHEIIFFCVLTDFSYSILTSLCRINRHLISALHKSVNHIWKFRLQKSHSWIRIVNK